MLPPDARRGGPRRLLQGLHTQRTARKHAVDATTTTKATRGCRPNALVTRMPAMDATYAMLPIMQLADLRHLAGLPCNMLCMRHSALNSRRLAIWVQRQAKFDICHPFRWYSACSAVRYRHAMTEHTSTAAGACSPHLRRDCTLLLGPKGTRAVHAGRTGCCSQRADRSKALWPCDIVVLSRAISFGARIALYGSAHSRRPSASPALWPVRRVRGGCQVDQVRATDVCLAHEAPLVCLNEPV